MDFEFIRANLKPWPQIFQILYSILSKLDSERFRKIRITSYVRMTCSTSTTSWLKDNKKLDKCSIDIFSNYQQSQ